MTQIQYIFYVFVTSKHVTYKEYAQVLLTTSNHTGTGYCLHMFCSSTSHEHFYMFLWCCLWQYVFTVDTKMNFLKSLEYMYSVGL